MRLADLYAFSAIGRAVRRLVAVVVVAAAVAVEVLVVSAPVHASVASLLDPAWNLGSPVAVTADATLTIADSGQVTLVTTAYPNHVHVQRFTSVGVPDPMFGVQGVADVAMNGVSTLFIAGVKSLSDGTLMVLGRDPYVSGSGFLAKFKLDGTLDSGFSVDGVFPLVGQSPVAGLLVAPDGSLYVAGDSDVSHVDAAGTQFVSWDGGVTMLPLGEPGLVGVQPDGKLLISVLSFVGRFVERYWPNGVKESVFTPVTVGDQYSRDVVAMRQFDGGLVRVDHGWRPAVVTYFTVDGTVDPTRPALTINPQIADPRNEASSVQVVAAGANGALFLQVWDDSAQRHKFRRLFSSGRWDESFGDHGVADYPSASEWIRGAQVDRSGRLMVQSTRFLGTDSLMRLQAHGGVPLVIAPTQHTGHATPGSVRTADPVDTATGNLTDAVVDVSAGVFGLGVVRAYNGLSTVESTAGPRWTVSTGPAASMDGDAVTVTTSDGSPFRYPMDGSGGYITPDGIAATLTIDPAVPSSGGAMPMLRWTHTDGNVDRFDTTGRLIQQMSWDGQTADLGYDAAGRLATVTSSTGLSLSFTHNTPGWVTGVSASTGRTVAYGYNAAGLLTSATDEFGATTTYTYTPEGWLLTAVDPSGVVLEANIYDSRGRVVSQTAPNGGVTTFVYSDGDATTEVTHSLTGATVRYAHDQYGKVTAVTDPFGNSVERIYDEQANLVGVIGRDNTQSTTTYDANDNVTSTTVPGSGTTSYTYDGANRVTAVTDPYGQVTTYTYTGIDRIPTTVTDALGAMTTHVVVNGLTMSTTDPDGVKTSHTYDAARRLTSITDGLGNVTSYIYDTAGRRTSVTAPGGRVSTWTYSPAGRLVSTMAPGGAVTSYTYDATGRLLTTTDPTGAVTTNHYDVAGQLDSVTDPSGNTTSYTIDSNGQVIATTAPGASISTTSYGALSRVMSSTDPLGRTTSYGYNSEGATTTVTDPTGAVRENLYDSNGRVSQTKDAAGRLTTTNYDNNGRVISTVTPTGTTSHAYDALGRTASTTDQRDGVTQTSYTPAGRMHSVSDPAGLTTNFGYDAAGRRVTVTSPGGRVTTTTYNAASDVSTVTSPGGLVTSFTYDSAGRQATATDPAGVVTTRTYTLRGELKTEKVGTQGAASYTYNPNGTMASVTDPLGKTTTFGYDGRGNMTSRTNALGGIDTWTYDKAGQLVESKDPLGRVTTATYDAAGRPTTVTDPTGSTVATAYNLDGTPVATTPSSGVPTVYTYDAAGRVATAQNGSGTTSYSYTPAGDLASTSAQGRVTSWAHDQAGRRTRMTYPDGNSIKYAYNTAGQLTSITPGELMADRFANNGAQPGNPLPTTKWTTTAVSGGTATINNALILFTPATAGASVTVTSKTAARLNTDITFAYPPTDMDVTSSAKMTLYARYSTKGHYRVEFPTNMGSATIYKQVGAVSTALGTIPLPVDTGGNFRFQAIGTTVKVKYWKGPEPAAWTAAYTGTGVTTAGTQRIAATGIPGNNWYVVSDWHETDPSVILAPLATYTYNADGQVTSETLRGGTRTHTYTQGRLAAYNETVPGLTQATTLTYDTTGRIATETNGAVTTTYGFDAAGQLTSATPSTGTALSWTYDALGQRKTDKAGTVTTSYLYDPAGQLCWTTTKALPVNPACGTPVTGATTYTWDAAGRMTGQTVTATNKVIHAYDPFGRVTTTTRVNGTTTTTQQRTYQPSGLLAAVDNTVTTATATTTKATIIDWDTSQGLAQPLSFASGGTVTDLMRGPTGWVSAQTAQTISPLGTDAYGSVIPTTGTTTIARNNTYTPFGAPTAGTTTFDPRLGYRGEIYTDNQLYLRARNYQPTIGRFTTRDKLAGHAGATTLTNPYHYTDNKPLQRLDPTGFTAINDNSLKPKSGPGLTCGNSCIPVTSRALPAGAEQEFNLPPACSAQTSTFGDSVAEQEAFINDLVDRQVHFGENAAACMREVGTFALNFGLSFVPFYDCVKLAKSLIDDGQAAGWDIAGCAVDAAGVIVGLVVTVREGRGVIKTMDEAADVATNTAMATVDDLSGSALSNYNRFVKNLPAAAETPTITNLADGALEFSAKVPATNIPGSYATYTKIVGPDGVTTSFIKTTIAPDGSVVSVKVKYP